MIDIRIERKRFTVNLLIAVTLTFMVSCSSSDGSESISTPGFTYGTAYLPHVESVSWPDQLREGVAFEISLELSAQSYPEMLRGLTHLSMSDFGWIDYDSQTKQVTIDLSTWCILWDYYQDGDDLVTEIQWPVDGLPAGTHILQVWTADSREWGGLSARFEVTPTTRRPEHEHATMRVYVLTVLPVEEEEE